VLCAVLCLTYGEQVYSDTRLIHRRDVNGRTTQSNIKVRGDLLANFDMALFLQASAEFGVEEVSPPTLPTMLY
jgi:hypothetical protein